MLARSPALILWQSSFSLTQYQLIISTTSISAIECDLCCGNSCNISDRKIRRCIHKSIDNHRWSNCKRLIKSYSRCCGDSPGCPILHSEGGLSSAGGDEVGKEVSGHVDISVTQVPITKIEGVIERDLLGKRLGKLVITIHRFEDNAIESRLEIPDALVNIGKLKRGHCMYRYVEWSFASRII